MPPSPTILIVEDDQERRAEIMNGLSQVFPESLLKKLTVWFSETGHDACLKFNKYVKAINLVLINPSAPWVNDSRGFRYTNDFLSHVKTPCHRYEGEIAIISDTLMGNIPHEHVPVEEVPSFICSFLKKNLTEKSLV